MKKSLKKTLIVGVFFIIIISLSLVNGCNKVIVKDYDSLDSFTDATWMFCANKTSQIVDAQIFSKYKAKIGKRAWLIEISDSEKLSIILSDDGINIEKDTSLSARDCSIDLENTWQCFAITKKGKNLTYYKNGLMCDTDITGIKTIHNSPANVFINNNEDIFNGSLNDIRSLSQKVC